MAWIPGARVQGGVLLLRGGPGDLPEQGEDGELAWGQRACGGHPVVVKPALILTTTLRVLLHWPKDSAGIPFTDGASAVGRASAVGPAQRVTGQSMQHPRRNWGLRERECLVRVHSSDVAQLKPGDPDLGEETCDLWWP